MCCFGDAITLQRIDNDAIDNLEKFVLNELEDVMQSWNSPTEINFEDFYGRYHSNKKGFQISLGERVMILEIQKYIESTIAKNSIQYFSNTYPEKSRKKRNTADDLCETVDIVNVGRFFTKKKSPKAKCTKGDEVLKQQLFKNVYDVLIKNGVQKDIMDKFTIDQTDILINGSDIQGFAYCPLCPEDKKKKRKIPNKRTGNNLFWTLSNFQNHLTDIHNLKSTGRKKNETIRLQNKSNEKTSNEKGDIGVNTIKTENIPTVNEINSITLLDSNKVEEIRSEHILDHDVENDGVVAIKEVPRKYSDNVNEYENNTTDPQANQIDEIESANISDESFEEIAHEKTIQLEIEFVVCLENNISDQIDRQISLMVARSLVNSEATSEMQFEVADKIGCVQITKIHPDGACMFGSLSHQIYGFKLGSDDHKKSVQKLRSDVVEFIKTDLYLFEHEIKECLYNERAKNKIKGKIIDFEKEANNFLANHLAKDSYWGGAETLKAILHKYQVNILIINEDGGCYYYGGFNANLIQSLIVAYRLNPHYGNAKTGGIRNHYDSVVGMGGKTRIEISRALATASSKHLDEQEVIDID